MLKNLPRLARTLKPLHASQLVWRGRYALERKLPAPHIALPGVAGDGKSLGHLVRSESLETDDLASGVAGVERSEPPAGRASRAQSQGDFRSDACHLSERVAQLAEGTFRHLNLALTLGRANTDWRLGPQREHRLWTITLHYHEWLYDLARAIRNESAGSARADQVALAEDLFTTYLFDWIRRCDLREPGARHLAWNSYAIATRIGWWIRSYRLLGDDWWSVRGALHGGFLGGLWRQAEFLASHPEWDLRGNHILRNAVGLARAARFFTGDRPNEWMAAAEAIAADQIDEQILSDGGHFERSPMYHAHVLEDAGSLARLVASPPLRAKLAAVHARMADYLAWMKHPDGGYALFNDGALDGVSTGSWRAGSGEVHLDSPRPEHPAPGTQLPRARYFSASGYCVWHGAPWSVFVDVGEVGPDCQPGHAHADTLSLECSFRGVRLFVDPGTHGYDDDATRRYDRSTAAHNTVCIDGRDSSEVWHIFRVGARARPQEVRVDYTPDRMLVEAAHNGYDRLPGAPRHWRRVVVTGDELTVTDRISGWGAHEVSGGWLLGPEWRATAATGGWDLERGGESVGVRVTSSHPLELSIEPASWHPEYGLELTVPRLVWRHSGELPLEVMTVITPKPATS